ncbi:M12 family metallo-peptidase [Flavobacterium sp.]|uniref:M12 family metallo-peptidase n=1 Tax=Flavobacterium sp. TaxID=239 RepID=UPI003752E7EB
MMQIISIIKKVFIGIILLNHFFSYSQQEIPKKVAEFISKNTKFETISTFQSSDNKGGIDISKTVNEATLAKINLEQVNKIITNKYHNIEIEIPYQGKTINVQLYQVDIYAEGFHVDTDKEKNINYQKGIHYRGIVKGDEKSVASFSFFKDEFSGLVSNANLSNLTIGKLQKPNNIEDYIIYADSNLKTPKNFKCNELESDGEIQEKNIISSQNKSLTTKCVTVYYEMDYDFYLANGSSIYKTTNWMSAAFNSLQTLYNNDGISIAFKSLFIWTTQDPYQSVGPTSAEYYNKFESIRPNFDANMGMQVGLKDGDLGGIAGGMQDCSMGRSYCNLYFEYDAIPLFSNTINLMAHEFGHTLSSPHTHSCSWNGNNTPIDNCPSVASWYSPSAEGFACYVPPGIIPRAEKGTFMSYCQLVDVGVNFANGFGPQPKQRIINFIESRPCLGTTCINTCFNKITTSSVSNITNTTATISWTEEANVISSEVSIFPVGETSGSWITLTTNPQIITGLLPNTYYKILFKNGCSEGLLGTKSIFTTSGDFCSGIQLTDSGGAAGNYKNNENITRTIIPGDTKAQAKITFTEFDLELNQDYLHIYNGPDATFKELTNSGLTGNTVPKSITSTAIDGSLTLRFESTSNNVKAGYLATVSCSAGTIDFSYYPNPTIDLLSIVANMNIQNVTIYNVAGQLLYDNQMNDSEINVDMTKYATGTYFFKLKFVEKEVNFKVLKL